MSFPDDKLNLRGSRDIALICVRNWKDICNKRLADNRNLLIQKTSDIHHTSKIGFLEGNKTGGIDVANTSWHDISIVHADLIPSDLIRHTDWNDRDSVVSVLINS